MVVTSQFEMVAKAYGFALEKEVKKYGRAIKLSRNFLQLITPSWSSEDKTFLLTDGTAIVVTGNNTELFWGAVNMKAFHGKLSGDRSHVTFTIPPLKIFLTRLNDLFIIGEIFAEHAYQPFASATLRGKTVVDIGSFIGISPIYFALLGARVFGYEVLPKHYQYSLLNVTANHLSDNITITNKGVGGIPRSINAPLDFGSYSYSVYEPTSCKETTSIEVITLEDIMEKNKITSIDLLKMDCEGAEYEIFEHIERSTLKQVKEVVMEIHGPTAPVISKLKECGFLAVPLRKSIRAINRNYGL